jgi:hypothetical protein
LEEDKIAQQIRNNQPDAMDIYDTIKTQGMVHIKYDSNVKLILILLYLAPTRSMIQQELIDKESDEGLIHGETSWIACGIKIQEMQ